MLPYTSGTTGRPKGCRHSHATVLASNWASQLWRSLNADAVILAVAPLFHMRGMQNGMNLPLVLGGTGALAISPALRENMPYNVARDFAPMVLAASFAQMLVTGNQVPVASVKELVTLAKSRKGQGQRLRIHRLTGSGV